jgi:hypothetical protein
LKENPNITTKSAAKAAVKPEPAPEIEPDPELEFSDEIPFE